MASRAGFESTIEASGEVAPPSTEAGVSTTSTSNCVNSTDAAASAETCGPPRGSNDSNSASEASDNDSSDEASEVEEEEEEDDGGGVDASRCDVCGSDASWEDSPIILCDGCDVAVHSLCFGVNVSSLRSPDALFTLLDRGIEEFIQAFILKATYSYFIRMARRNKERIVFLASCNYLRFSLCLPPYMCILRKFRKAIGFATPVL